jgi:hypothetical protein
MSGKQLSNDELEDLMLKILAEDYPAVYDDLFYEGVSTTDMLCDLLEIYRNVWRKVMDKAEEVARRAGRRI